MKANESRQSSIRNDAANDRTRLDRCRDEPLWFVQQLPEQAFDNGAMLLMQGERSGRLFILINGAAGVERDGIEVAAVDLSGAIFGEFSYW